MRRRLIIGAISVACATSILAGLARLRDDGPTRPGNESVGRLEMIAECASGNVTIEFFTDHFSRWSDDTPLTAARLEWSPAGSAIATADGRRSLDASQLRAAFRKVIELSNETRAVSTSWVPRAGKSVITVSGRCDSLAVEGYTFSEPDAVSLETVQTIGPRDAWILFRATRTWKHHTALLDEWR